MSEEFEWVSKKSSHEEEKKNNLPVTLEPNTKQDGIDRFFDIAKKVLLIIGTVILGILARMLLLIARVKLPKISVPPAITAAFHRILSGLSSYRPAKPAWVKIPDFVYRIRIPQPIISSVVSGVCFIVTLAGTGAIFSLYEQGYSFGRLALVIAGIAGALWMMRKRSSAEFMARWILEFLRKRNQQGR